MRAKWISLVAVGTLLSSAAASASDTTQPIEDGPAQAGPSEAELPDGIDGGVEGADEVAQNDSSDTGMGTDGLADYVESQLSEPEQSFPYFEAHGYFRFRGDNFWNLDLNTQGTSPILPPLEATSRAEDTTPSNSDIYDPDAELLSSANIRFRFHPIVHITDDMRIHTEMDFFDNLVLGSTPDGFTNFGAEPNNRDDVPIVGFTPGQQVQNEDLTFRDAFRLRQAYAEMKFLGLIRVGRMASNWGLGMLANNGGSFMGEGQTTRYSYRGIGMQGFNCIDCDYGDIVDRFLFITRPLDRVYVGFVYDWPSAGTTGYIEDQPFGQPRDLSQVDDVNQFGFMLLRAHLGDDERRERDRVLKEERRPVFDAGVYLIRRTQEGDQVANGFLPNDTEGDIFLRRASAWIPDIWVRMLWEPAFKQRIRLEIEAVGIFGEIENVKSGLPEDDSNRELQQIGVAFESDFRFDKLVTGLNAGYASGRSTVGENARLAPGWGVQDLNPVTGGSATDREVTNFKFDRDYFVDQIMFREIIGTITNAIYFNPFFQYDFFTAQTNAMGARIDLIYALAPKPEVTPGGDAGIGLEADAAVYYQGENYRASVSGGVFFPFGAFNGETGRARIPAVADFWELNNAYEEAIDAEEAWTLQFHLMWAF